MELLIVFLLFCIVLIIHVTKYQEIFIDGNNLIIRTLFKTTSIDISKIEHLIFHYSMQPFKNAYRNWFRLEYVLNKSTYNLLNSWCTGFLGFLHKGNEVQVIKDLGIINTSLKLNDEEFEIIETLYTRDRKASILLFIVESFVFIAAFGVLIAGYIVKA